MGGDLLIPPQASSVAIFDSLQSITVKYSLREYMKTTLSDNRNIEAATGTE
jgi:hypothetical protein